MASLPKPKLHQRVKESTPPVSAIAAVLDAALDAHRAGTLDRLLLRRPRILQWITRHYLQPILGTAGDRLPARRRLAAAVELLLRWAVARLRPDQEPELALTSREAWLEQASWRPFIALICHYSFAPVPDFRDHYYRHPNESPADNLCGLWNISQSTFYRYVEKGKRLMVRLLCEQHLDQRHTASLRDFVWRMVVQPDSFSSPAERTAWHRRQAQAALQSKDPLSAFWHLHAAGDVPELCRFVRQHLAFLVGHSEFDLRWQALLDRSAQPGEQIELLLTTSAIYRMWGDDEGEQAVYQEALHLAVQSQDAQRMGIVYSYLGRFYEPRDADRAFTYYQEAAELLVSSIEDQREFNPELAEEYMSVLVRISWLHTLRNDPRARFVLERVEALRPRIQLDDDKQALIQQAWGEYWRRAKDPAKALEHTLHALSIYEKLNNQPGVVKTYINLSLVYGELRQFQRAIEYGNKALSMADFTGIGPEATASTHLNLGANYFWLGNYDTAIAHYRQGLQVAVEANLKLHIGRAHYNLAEAFYTRFRIGRAAEDELRGDAHVEAALAAWPYESDPAYIEQTKNLKAEVLGENSPSTCDRLLPQETAAHYAEIASIEQQRAILATSDRPEDRIRAHLAIANAYLTISVKERETALALIEKHGLGDRFADEFRQLNATFGQTLTRQQRLAVEWQAKAGDLLNDARRAATLKHLLENGAINKSNYARLCRVGLATASNHLVHLARLGLLRQIGRGPSTRYVLPDEE
jgi:tetratricopeptide (TPR) repeat protein